MGGHELARVYLSALSSRNAPHLVASVTIADLDGDGRLDIAATAECGTNEFRRLGERTSKPLTAVSWIYVRVPG